MEIIQKNNFKIIQNYFEKEKIMQKIDLYYYSWILDNKWVDFDQFIIEKKIDIKNPVFEECLSYFIDWINESENKTRECID